MSRQVPFGVIFQSFEESPEKRGDEKIIMAAAGGGHKWPGAGHCARSVHAVIHRGDHGVEATLAFVCRERRVHGLVLLGDLVGSVAVLEGHVYGSGSAAADRVCVHMRNGDACAVVLST